MMTSDLPVLDKSAAHALADWLMAARSTGAVALIDKQELWTSFDCVKKLRFATKSTTVGHAGTLDPLATGLLVVCFGKATKQIASIQDAAKTYDVTVRLGATTATDDRGAPETSVITDLQLDVAHVEHALQQFVGTITQTPPSFAAIRHNGKRQYDLAREGKPFTPRERMVDVHSIANVNVALPDVSFTVHCGKGTYIRSIARDLGNSLGCGGYVWALRRTAIAPYSVDNALTVEDVIELTSDVSTK